MGTFLRASRASAVVLLIGCGGTSTVVGTGTTDAGHTVDANVATDTPSDTNTPSDAVSSGNVATGSDGGACAQITGYYVITGSCTPALVALPTVACVTQSGCALTMSTDNGTFTGTSSAGAGTVTNNITVSGIAVSVVCTLTPGSNGVVNIICTGGGVVTCTGVGTPGTVTGATSTCCDAVGQNCAAGQRCELVTGAAGSVPEVTACLATTGTVAAGGACTYDATMSGNDNCGPGLFCNNTGVTTAGMGVCRQWCDGANSACASGTACLRLSTLGEVGVCIATCTLWTGTCPTGTRCFPSGIVVDASDETISGVCRDLGTIAANAPCTGPRESCVDGYSCAQATGDATAMCHQICDASHPCAISTQTCTPYSGQSAGATLGLCI